MFGGLMASLSHASKPSPPETRYIDTTGWSLLYDGATMRVWEYEVKGEKFTVFQGLTTGPLSVVRTSQ
jgi:hypothetical protein